MIPLWTLLERSCMVTWTRGIHVAGQQEDKLLNVIYPSKHGPGTDDVLGNPFSMPVSIWVPVVLLMLL